MTSPLAAALGRRAAPDYAGDDWVALNRVSSEFADVFSEAGFKPIEPAVLQPADLLFDLYGEEIWERAFLIEDDRSETWCLRPDFTVPVVRAHLASGIAARPARYGYFGPVFRRATGAEAGPLQHLQAGVEILGEPSAPEADAEILDISLKALELAGVGKGAGGFETVVGDLAVVAALLDAAEMPQSWRRRLRRRFRRPDQFASLLGGFGGALSGEAAARQAYLKSVGALEPADAAAAAAKLAALAEAPQIGVRSAEEIIERFLRQAADATAHPLPEATRRGLEEALSLSAPLPAAPAALRSVEGLEPTEALGEAIDALEARIAALAARGVAVDALRYDADFGRNLEYYDGFVFEMQHRTAEGAIEKLGGGGRYDRLCRALAPETPFAGVGVALRPEAALALIAAAEAEGGA